MRKLDDGEFWYLSHTKEGDIITFRRKVLVKIKDHNKLTKCHNCFLYPYCKSYDRWHLYAGPCCDQDDYTNYTFKRVDDVLGD